MDTEQNQHKFLKFQIMNPYPIHSMTQESPTHSLWLMAYPSMIANGVPFVVMLAAVLDATIHGSDTDQT